MSQLHLRPIALSVAIALLVVTAGCSGFLGGGGNGYDANGSELDGATLTNQTAAAVESSGSYTLNSTATITGERQGSTVTSATDETMRIDFESDRGIRSTERTLSSDSATQSVSVVVYTDGSTSYRRQNGSNGVTYDVQEGGYSGVGSTTPVNTTGFAQNYTGFVDEFGWERNGTETVDGVTVTSYAAVQNGTSAGIGNASGQLLVDSDGVIREITLSYTLTDAGSPTTIELSIVLSDVGSTTVEEPDWVAEAQAQSS